MTITLDHCMVVLSLGIQQFSVILADCENQICKLGYEFCETEKEVCRQCSDFQEFCFVDNKHLSNCSSYCKEILSPSSCKECSLIWLYTTLPGLAILAVVCSVLIYEVLRLRRKLTMDDSKSSTGTDASSEEESDLLKKSQEEVDHLQQIQVDREISPHRRADPNGFVPPIQPATADNQDNSPMIISGRPFPPRD
ncbi:unnamed protein product [Mytilus coruscus]|uniref:Uncharacterized protein n=1 Tax=Mytilus coruscus TaxID=42192 RepID=A0A6J8BNQ0_MYTCO|nr:unnamed protein product [Mytilus coruscus]